ncbi:MAG: nitroreductase family protein [Salaquimonas sp.]|nr:nitroreductase family protein [Salaquimonas sp.]
MNVSEAVRRRMSARAFLEKPVATETIVRALEKAARAPSGGNLQPWHVAVVNGDRMSEFRAIMEKRLAGEAIDGGETAEYAVYPPNLKEPYRTRRFQNGEEMYATLGIAREDRPARLKRFAENFRFFGAPAAIFCFVDRVMGAPQWSDLGMFLQTFLLLLTEEGLDTCAQECWAAYPRTVAEFCGMDRELMLFCGMAIGYRDETAAVNRMVSTRAPASEWLKVL